MGYQFYGAIGSVIAALIAGIVGLAGLIISKESKLSEFRQAWIDSLRSEVANLVSNLHLARRYAINLDISKDAQRALSDADSSLFLIRLRLNSDEVEAGEVLETLQRIEDFSSQNEWPLDQVTALERELISKTKLVLKSEWKRVKTGERAYRAAKIASYLLVVALSLFLVSAAILAFAESDKPSPVSKSPAKALELSTPTPAALPPVPANPLRDARRSAR